MAHGWSRSEEINQTLPTISLVAQSEKNLEKAFEEFHAWAQITDSDSVEITFVFLKRGGYVLAISPEFTRLLRRCLGFDRAHQMAGVGPIWYKLIHTVHPLLLRFRDYCSSPIAQILFGGVTYVGPTAGLADLDPEEVTPIPSIKPLLKFEATFIDEEQVASNTIASGALQMLSHQEIQSGQGRGEPELDEIGNQRAKALRHHFPVTLERIGRSSFVSSVTEQLTKNGVKLWQIEQALCNLVLSADMGRGSHFLGLSARKTESAIVEVIGSRYELADGSDIPRFTIEDITTQVIADGNAFLRHLKKKQFKELPEVQAVLQSVSALEAPTAADF